MSAPRRTLFVALVLAALASSGCSNALAHGGEDHGEPAAPAAIANQTTWSIADSSETFELVAVHDKLLPGKPSRLLLYLSDFNTNKPIESAKITVEMSGAASLTAPAIPGSMPGEYVAQITLPSEGAYAAAVTVETKVTTDILGLNPINVGEQFYAAPEVVPPVGGGPPWKGIAIGAILLIPVLLTALLFSRRRRPAATAALAAFLALLTASPRRAAAHGGEDHGNAGASAAASGNHGDALIISKPAQFLLEMQTAPAEMREIAPTMRIVGRIEAAPDGEARVLAPFDGSPAFVPGRRLLPGMRVSAGETLVLLAPSFDLKDQLDFTSRKREAGATYQRAEGTARVARGNWERSQKLKLVLSEKEQQEIQATYDAASAELDAARAIRDSIVDLEIRKNRMPIVSPIDGLLAEFHLTTGTVVQKDAEMFRVIDPARLWVHGEVYENQIAAVSHVSEGWVDVPASGKHYRVTLLSRPLAIDPATRTAHVYFTIEDPDKALLPELTATLTVRTGTPEQTLAVPRVAVVEQNGKQVVFVHTAPEQFKAREVETGWNDDDWVEIVHGLVKGDRVVVKGNYELKNAAAGGR